jgi:hypothetical protein
MSSAIYIDNIESYLFRLADLIEHSNSLNRSNRTVDAENLFCVLLNTAFGWELVNANEKTSNQDTFDLIDKKNNLAIQVTSNKSHLRKFNSTITAIRKKRNKEFNRFIVLFISRKCPERILKKVKVGEFQYEGYDIPKLLKEIYHKNKTSKKLKEINEFLEIELSPVPIGAVRPKDIIPVPEKPVIKKRGTGLYINRNKLIKEIFSFGQIANGLIIGGPGIGKSFTIEEIQRLCSRKKLDCFVIRINELIKATDRTLAESLGMQGNKWIEGLKKIEPAKSSKKNFLIFDAYDTAKDEKIKSAVLKQIQKAINQLSDKWSILVSARTFDAIKSNRLLELFPYANIHKAVSCRYFEIPELSEPELLFCLRVDKELLSVYEKSTDSLKRLLKVPYFLKILEKIVEQNKVDKRKLPEVETEEQLLKIFWESKVVVDTATDLFLQKLTGLLAAIENLSCRKETILNESNYKVYDDLTSLGILVESSSTKRNISFSHNILLDYAISIYLIPEESKALVTYVASNQKMPFLFRQSFIYYYSRLWNINQDLFWEHYFATQVINQPLFRLFHQTILNFVLGGFYNKISELSPVFSLPDGEEKSNIIRKILEGLRFINKGNFRERDYDLLAECSRNIADSTIWILGFLTAKAIEQLKANPNGTSLKKITTASQNLLDYLLKQRHVPASKMMVDMNGSFWGVQNVISTYAVKRTVAKRLLNSVLLILQEEDFPIRYFNSLSDQLLEIYKNDPAFGIKIYKTLYYHNENNDKETYLGSSVVLALRSNRRQDYEMIHYKLEKDYTEMLQLYPEPALRLGIEIVNRFSLQKPNACYKFRTFSFLINGIKVRMTSDYSFYDSDHDKENGPFSHLENIFKFFEKLVIDNKITEARKLIRIVFFHINSTTIWRRLLKLLVLHPKQFKQEALWIIKDEHVFVSDETIYDAGDLINALWRYLSAAEKLKVEQNIVNLSSSKLVNKNDDVVEKIINLLASIPGKKYLLKESKKIMKDNRKTNRNTGHSTTRPQNPSEDEKLRDMGVISSDALEIEACKLIKKIEPFTGKYDYNNSETPDKKEFEELVPLVSALFEISKTQTLFSQRLLFNCDYEVSRYAKLVASNIINADPDTRNFVEEIALHYISDPNYMEVVYQEGESKTRSSVFSPTPRTAATGALIYLLDSDTTGKVAPLVKSLVSDNITFVRYKALRALPFFWQQERDIFWKILEERVPKEKDGLCLHELIKSVGWDNIIKEEQALVEKISALAIVNLLDNDGDATMELWRGYATLILRLLIYYKSDASRKIIDKNLGRKIFVKCLVIEIMTVLDPHRTDNDYEKHPNRYNNLFEIIHSCLKVRFENLKVEGITGNIKDDFEIIDFCIQQFFFTITKGKKSSKGNTLNVRNKVSLYFKSKPVLRFIVDESIKIETGFMVAHTGYYFMQLMNEMLDADPEFILNISSDIVKCASANNFTYDQTTMREIVKLTEKLLADHKEIISRKEHFNSLINILDQFASSGWQEALELTWRLKEIF